MTQTDSPTGPQIECHGVVCNDLGLMEVQDGQVSAAVPRPEVRRIVLRDGYHAPYPGIQAAAGVGLVALGYFPIAHLMDWLEYGGMFLTGELWMTGFAAIGIWLLLTAFRRGLFFEVETTRGRKRLLFRERPEQERLDDFISSIERRYDMRVDVDNLLSDVP